MKRILFTLALGANVTPVQKVVQMLDGMLVKGKQAKHEEQVQFATYRQWCDDSIRQKSRAIQDEKQRVEILSADIQKFNSDADAAADRVAEIDAEVASKEGDIAASTKIRKIEREQYQETHKDYTESIDAIGRAVMVLQQQNYDRKAKAFLSEDAIARVMSPDEKKVIEKFLQQDPELAEVGGPEAHGYEFQSSSVVICWIN